MDKLNPIIDGLPDEAFQAIAEISKNIGIIPRIIFVGGGCDGMSTVRYLEMFPDAVVYFFEPEQQNYELAELNLRPYGNRVKMFPVALTSQCGEVSLNINSHFATHSIFEIGKVELWDEFVFKEYSKVVQTLTIDSILQNEKIDQIDILHLDTQGAELLGLIGATSALIQNKIQILRIEVEFEKIYKDQPLFWEIGLFLSSYNYRFIKNVDLKFRKSNIPRLVWADSIFLSNE